jgi:hypothetical protein
MPVLLPGRSGSHRTGHAGGYIHDGTAIRLPDPHGEYFGKEDIIWLGDDYGRREPL